MNLVCIPLMTCGIEHLIRCLLVICISSFVLLLFKYLPIFYCVIFFSNYQYKSSLNILNKSFPVMCFANIFSQSVTGFEFPSQCLSKSRFLIYQFSFAFIMSIYSLRNLCSFSKATEIFSYVFFQKCNRFYFYI